MIVDKPIRVLPGDVRCPRCFGKDLAPSMPRGWRDALMRVLGKVPRHCRFCERRFYVRWPADEVAAASGAIEATQGKGAAACAAAPEEVPRTDG